MSSQYRGDNEEIPDDLPDFDLDCMYDNWDDPRKVTIYSTEEDESIYTAWITADKDYAVSLENTL